jgi:hypothetical protein
MTPPGSSAKFIGFFRLIDACGGPGCPVCRCLVADTRQYLDGLLYEHVNDPETRSRLRASWGFCNWHAWMLREASDPAFGSAILYEDMVRGGIRKVERLSGRVTGGGGRFIGWLHALVGRRRLPVLVELYRRRPMCPACRQTADSEERYIDSALRFVDDPQFDRAYRKSQGLCMPHALHALEVDRGRGAAEQLLSRTLPKWTELRKDLDQFVSKHEYRNRDPFTEAEGTAYVRAFEAMTGTPGLFPSDLRRSMLPPIRRPSDPSGSPGDVGDRGEPAPAFECGKLELRVKELSEQLSDATSRAAALHYRLAQVAEDRNALEVNLSGERGANQLSQRVILDLRREVEQLKAAAVQAAQARVSR